MANYTVLPAMENNANFTKEELVREFFYAGYTYIEISAVLCLKGQPLSTRQVRRTVKKLGLSRRQVGLVDECRLRDVISSELRGSGGCLGYRSMKNRLLSKYGFNISRARVAKCLKEMDPKGVESRTTHCLSRRMYINSGPNYLIHIDGYDKLKRYGFAIHGGICGFSRRLLWLKVNRSNNNPRVIAGYFHEFMDEIKGVPRCIRGDRGTENTLVEKIQKAFRWNHVDDMSGEMSYHSGRSASNQRIERWWLSQKQGGGQFWIDYFKDLESNGIISTTETSKIEALRFCFTKIIQGDLDECRQEWNQHSIRKMKTSVCPAGKPDLMFFTPELYGAVDYKVNVPLEDIDALSEFCEYPLPSGCTQELESYFVNILEENNRCFPSSQCEALELYLWLLK